MFAHRAYCTSCLGEALKRCPGFVPFKTLFGPRHFSTTLPRGNRPPDRRPNIGRRTTFRRTIKRIETRKEIRDHHEKKRKRKKKKEEKKERRKKETKRKKRKEIVDDHKHVHFSGSKPATPSN
jgi:hypothetical protein